MIRRTYGYISQVYGYVTVTTLLPIQPTRHSTLREMATIRIIMTGAEPSDGRSRPRKPPLRSRTRSAPKSNKTGSGRRPQQPNPTPTELITQARASDQRTAQEARAAVEELRSEHQAIADAVTALGAEQQHRVEHPDPAADQERQRTYAAGQAAIAAEELDTADTYTQDPYAYDPSQDMPDVSGESFER